MNVTEIMAAWKEANNHGTYSFYERFCQLTGIPEDRVKYSFADWNRTRPERVEEIAQKHGVTVREGGSQAFLAERYWPDDPELQAIQNLTGHLGDPDSQGRLTRILDVHARLGRFPIDYAILPASPQGAGDPREGKGWPPEEDCPGCPGRAGEDGPHKMSCSSEWGPKANGRMTIPFIWGEPVIVSEMGCDCDPDGLYLCQGLGSCGAPPEVKP